MENLIVYLIGILAVLYIVRKAYLSISGKGGCSSCGESGGCSGCGSHTTNATTNTGCGGCGSAHVVQK